MTNPSPPGVRRPMSYPRLAEADRPDLEQLAAERRAAYPRKPGRRPAATTPTTSTDGGTR